LGGVEHPPDWVLPPARRVLLLFKAMFQFPTFQHQFIELYKAFIFDKLYKVL